MAHGGGPSRRKSDLNIDDSGSDDEIAAMDGGWGWVRKLKFLFFPHPDLLMCKQH